MPTAQKLGLALIGLATLTTAVLPGRQTAPVANAVFGGARGLLATAMGTGRQV